MMESIDRRAWLATAALAATAAARGFSAAETIRIAVLGSGGRSRHLMRSLVKIPNTKLVAIADVRQDALDTTKKHLEEIAPGSTKDLLVSRRYEELLDDKNIDAVLIGSPDHQHVPMTVAAARAGKDIYVEKPLTHDPSEKQALLDAAKNSRSVIQVGMQQRSMPHIIKAGQLIKEGKIGKVHKVHMSWNRNSARFTKVIPGIDPSTVDWKAFLGTVREQAYDPYKMVHWRWFWDFGGGIFTDLMVHWIDVAHGLLGLEEPIRAASQGQFVHAEGIWETPDSVQTILSYPGGVTIHFEGTFANARHGAMICFMGTEGSIYCDRGAMQLIPDPGKSIQPQEWILGKGRRGADFYDVPDGEMLHLTNWIDAVRTRKEPSAPLKAGIEAAFAAHLANMSLRGNRIATNPTQKPKG